MIAKGNLEIEFIAKFWRDDVKPPLMKALELVPDDRLDWAPAEKMISLGNIFMHIAECSAWWISKLIEGKDFKEMTPGPSLPKNKILIIMGEHWQRIDGFLARAPEILEKVYSYKGEDKTWEFDGRWIMMHLLEHDIHHRCQIFQYLRIMGIGPPKT